MVMLMTRGTFGLGGAAAAMALAVHDVFLASSRRRQLGS
jgi:hypothetical protein